MNDRSTSLPYTTTTTITSGSAAAGLIGCVDYSLHHQMKSSSTEQLNNSSSSPNNNEYKDRMKFTLIELISNHPCLWQPNDVDFKNYKAREKSMKEIAEMMSTPVSECRRMWTMLKGQYKRELQEIARSPIKAQLKATWKFFKPLSFLQNVMIPKKEEESSSGTDVGPAPSLTLNLSPPTIPPEISQHFSEDMEPISPHEEDVLGNNTPITGGMVDADSLFGEYVVASLRNMNPIQREYTKLRFQYVLYDMSMNPIILTTATTNSTTTNIHNNNNN